MARDPNLKKVLILGSGPIVIGQAAEFDYSGTQACKALMKEGLEVILINSNPATIMTDPEVATRVYIEPLKLQYVEKIIEVERPDAVIPTLGGQTALNLALELHKSGVLEKYNVDLLGARPKTIEAAEDREQFRVILDEVGAKYPKSFLVRTFEQGGAAAEELGYPLILRPNYTLGGGGGGVAYSEEEYKELLLGALNESPTSEVLVEESIVGWKEFELEVMRDCAGTFVIICSIENFDPCGVHTGDSITVAPQQTLTDRQYQEMRDEAKAITEQVGVETGGANIQFAVHPTTGERYVIEMNPRVSRSSALASKATGFPIAKIAALLAIGYRLEELQNDITKSTPSCYEPALDYVVTKIPRFAFEKFVGSKDILSTQMKSVGEVMGIGRTFQESLMKAMLSLEYSKDPTAPVELSIDKISYPNSGRIYHLFEAFRQKMTVDQVYDLTKINHWFLEQVESLIEFEGQLEARGSELETSQVRQAKKRGFSDAAIARLKCLPESKVKNFRDQQKIRPAYQQVDTCAGEFASSTPYYYSTYWSEPAPLMGEGSIAIIGSGPNRIGQGIEFDYSCVRGVTAFRREGCRVAMINSNPETVSTDYDTSDDLFFEPLTAEHVTEVLEVLQPRGVVVQLGGQTAINIAAELNEKGFPFLGSSLASIDLAEDRGQFTKLCQSLDFQIPKSSMAGELKQALAEAENIGYPIICRPSYVLGGRRMEVIENSHELESYFTRHGQFISPETPCLMDQFLEGGLEVDVDLVRGPDWTIIGGVVEHIEAAGVHSGDSMGVMPPQRLKPETSDKIEELSIQLANKMEVIGYLNLQLAIINDEVFMLEANPRSSRSLPFVAKATSIPLVDLGVRAMLGHRAREVRPEQYNWKSMTKVCVKGVVFPFRKFPEADSILGPEMKSTGEAMGRGDDYSEALLKAFITSQNNFPEKGEVFFSLRDKDKDSMLLLARELLDMGYTVSATKGTATYFYENGVDCIPIKKVHEGRPNCVDRIRSKKVAMVINTTSGRQSIEASFSIRRACIDYAIPCLTESDAAEAFVLALRRRKSGDLKVSALDAPATL